MLRRSLPTIVVLLLVVGMSAPALAQPKVDVRELRARLVDLQSRIFKMKSNLGQLGRQVLTDVGTGSRFVLVHRDSIGGYFVLQKVRYFLNGRLIYQQGNERGELTARRVFEVYNGPLPSTRHTLNVEFIYRGNSKVFAYLDGYRYRLKSALTFVAPRGRITTVDVVGHERGGVAVDLQDRPHIRYDVRHAPLLRRSK